MLYQTSTDFNVCLPGAYSFNGKFRDECLSMEWFRNRLEARVVIEGWRRHYNEIRSHSSLNYQTPHEFVANLTNELTTGARISSSYRWEIPGQVTLPVSCT